MKKSLCFIVKPTSKEAERLDNALESAAQYFDEIVVTVTGHNKEVERIAKKHGALVSHFVWEDDFAKARNFNFAQATGDWIFWMDADDVLQGGEKLDGYVEQCKKNGLSGLFTMYWYDINKDKSVRAKHWKMRLIKNDGHGEWRGKLHEDFLQLRSANWGRIPEEDIRIVHHSDDVRRQESHLRNLALLEKNLDEEGENSDPRTLYYYGQALYSLQRYEDAKLVFSRYLDISGWDEERYLAYQIIVDCLIFEKDYDTAIDVALASTKERPDYPGAYFNLQRLYVRKGDHKRSLVWFDIGSKKKPPETNLIQFVDENTWKPLFLAAHSLLQLGKIDEAERHIKACLGVKDSEETKTLAELIASVKEKRDLSRSAVLITSYLEEHGQEVNVPMLLGGLPREIADNGVISALRNKYLPPKVWGEKDITIFCPYTIEAWSPKSLEEGGIGGSETAVVHLSKQLALLGWNVTVYNFCSNDAGVHEGVTYKNYWEFNIKDTFNVLISWRTPELFDANLDAKMGVLDLHDVMSVHDFPQDRLKNIDKVFVKTNYHKSLFPNIPEEKFVVINNGIDLERFSGSEKRNPKQMIYTSAPNRGLEYILDNFEKIVELVPDVVFKIFYGWKTFFEIEKDNPERMAWMNKMQARIAELKDKYPANIFDIGRIDQDELAREFMRSGVWSYPTSFAEISCITAMEAQAGGAIPVNTGYAALAETVEFGFATKGDIEQEAVQESWVELLCKVLDEEDNFTLSREEMMLHARKFSWEQVAKDWSTEITKWLSHSQKNKKPSSIGSGSNGRT